MLEPTVISMLETWCNIPKKKSDSFTGSMSGVSLSAFKVPGRTDAIPCLRDSIGAVNQARDSSPHLEINLCGQHSDRGKRENATKNVISML